jgi:hypothetical protein
MIRRHIKREFERDLSVNIDGKPKHNPCISHCLAYSLGVCKELHTSVCSNCENLWLIFEQLREYVGEDHFELLLVSQDKLIYYMAHLVRKVYLNAQFEAYLKELDQNGALIIVDYKMKVLRKSSRETKEDFFGKRGWTLHTVLLFTKGVNDQLDVRAFDHWSDDQHQDAYFTASSLHAVITSLEKKPRWVTFISNNGAHYHNSELMVILSYWFDWYQVEVKKWLFLEPGEAKTMIDSHHAQVCNNVYFFC